MALMTEQEIGILASEYRARGKKIVFTNGCFDIFHPGHLKLLTQAAKHGDILIVSLNSDNSVRNLKGPHRPIFPAKDRAFLLANLRPVDHVVIFKEDTAINLIASIRPHIYVKGGDYTLADVPEKDIVMAGGGKILLVPLADTYSSTDIIRALGKNKEEPF